MTRPLRLNLKRAYYHIIHRGNYRQKVFLDDADRKQLLTKLGSLARLFRIPALPARQSRGGGPSGGRMPDATCHPDEFPLDWRASGRRGAAGGREGRPGGRSPAGHETHCRRIRTL